MVDFRFLTRLEFRASVPHVFCATVRNRMNLPTFPTQLRYPWPTAFAGRVDPTTPCRLGRGNRRLIDIRRSRFFSGFNGQG